MNDEIASQIEQIRRSWDAIDFGKENLSKGLSDLFYSVTQTYPQQISIEMAVERLRWEFEKDKQPGSYYHTWQCNLSMCFYDTYRHHYDHAFGKDLHHIHDIANLAAVRFLELLCQQTESNIGLIKQNELQASPMQPPKQQED